MWSFKAVLIDSMGYRLYGPSIYQPPGSVTNHVFQYNTDALGNYISKSNILSSNGRFNLWSGENILQINPNNLILTYYKETYLLSDQFMAGLCSITNDLVQVEFELSGNNIEYDITGIKQLENGKYIVYGKKIDNNLPHTTGIILIVNEILEIEYEYFISASESVTSIYTCTPLSDGTIILGGYAQQPDTDVEMYYCKMDTLGNILWQHTILSESTWEWDGAARVIEISPDSLLLMGSLEWDLYLAYLNRDGEVIDEMHYTSPNDMGGTGASICHNLDYKNLDWPIPLKGFELAMGNPLRQYLYFMDQSLSIIYEKELTVDPNYNNYLTDFKKTPDGGYVFCGYIDYPDFTQGWFLKTDSLGNTCGMPNCDTTLIVQNPDTGISHPAYYNEFVISPNPIADVLSYRLQDRTPEEFPAAIQVYNLEGKLMATDFIPSGKIKGQLHSSNWASGIYVVNLRVGNSVVYSEKVVKQ